jgi:hypothetical protein
VTGKGSTLWFLMGFESQVLFVLCIVRERGNRKFATNTIPKEEDE